MARRSRITRVGLAARSLASGAGALIVVGLVVLVVTLAVVAYPRVTAGLLNAELRHTVSSAGAGVRDLQANPTGVTFGTFGDLGDGSISPTWKAMPRAMKASRATMPPALQAAADAGRYVGRANGPTGSPGSPLGVLGSGTSTAPPASTFTFPIEADPQLKSDAVLVSGAWPKPAATLPSDVTLQVVLSDASARAMGWQVGQTQEFNVNAGMKQTVELVGTIRPRDPTSDYWQLDTIRSRPGITYSADLSFTYYNAVAYVDASTWPSIAMEIGRPSIEAWFGIGGSTLDVATLPKLQSGLQHYLATPFSIGPSQPIQALRFNTLLADTLDDYVARTSPVSTLLSVFATGPLGSAIAVLFLGVRLLVARRRSALRLMWARGASPFALRARLALETAAAAIPGAAIGSALALGLTPGAPDAAAILRILACALAAPVVIAIAGGTAFAEPRAARHPLLSRVWILEVLVVALAALGVVVLLQRGIPRTGDPFSADPLVVLTPLLVAFAACIVVLRLYPIPLRALGAVLRRGRGVADYLGWASSMRAGTLWPMFAVITGVSITIFSLSVGTTERAGVETAALRAVGGDIRVSAPALTAAQVARIRSTPGVRATTSVALAGTYVLVGSTKSASVYLIDGAGLARSLHGLPDAQRPFTGLRPTSAPTGQIAPSLDASGAVTLQLGRETLKVDTTRSAVAPGDYIAAQNWIVMDRASAPALGTRATTVSVLVTLAPGADSSALTAKLTAIAGPSGQVLDTAQQIAAARAGPLLPGVDALTLAAVLLAALMCCAALVLTLVMNAAARVRLVGTLRTLGFTGRQATRLIGWELGPIVIAGLVAGGAVGVVLSVILLAAVDLAPVTGGATRPPLVLDPLVIAATIAGFVVAAGIATVLAIVLARRVSLATILRTSARD